MLKADWHTFQVLTKRSERLMQMLTAPFDPQQRLGTSGGGKRRGR